MQSTQLACPHCGSTLNFGTEIVAGTPVECLICMQTFAAEPMPAAAPTSSLPHTADMAPPTLSDTQTATIPKAVAAATVPTAKPVPVAKPYGVPLGAIADKPLPKPAPPRIDKANPAAPSIRRPDNTAIGNKVALFVVAFGLLFMLAGGVVFTIWKATSASRTGPSKFPGADDDGAPQGKDLILADGSSSTPVLSQEDEEQIRDRVREETKAIVLKRWKITKPGGAEVDWDSVTTFNVAKQGITGLDQERINRAIDKGVVYLKKTQQANGTWNNMHGVGHAAIGGLTLLECGVRADDPAVQRAAYYVRTNLANLRMTYELSLAILFLDRLGDQRDHASIQAMALTLMAGQNECGGWTYHCTAPSPQEMIQLYHFLQSNRPPSLMNPIRGDSPGLVMVKDGAGSKPVPAPANPLRREQLSPGLQKLPIVQNAGTIKGNVKVRGGDGDNSNTQFALLALWAARRHDVPTDQALLAAYQRFIASQHDDGGWGYQMRSGSTNTMTNVGLLGMAMGHGAAPEVINPEVKNPKEIKIRPALQDERIQKGLRALARHIGQPSTKAGDTNFPMQNLYFLWSVERVAMLYDLKTIGGKDWYGWGAQILVHNQDGDGAWPSSHYHGNNPPLNTCFALLFLKRSNLVQDLTNNLRLHSGILDTEK